MHSRAAIFVFLALTSSVALAGTVRFEPPVTLVSSDSGGQTVEVEAWLEADSAFFDNVTALFGSDDGLLIDMTYSPQFVTDAAFRTSLLPTDTPPGPIRPSLYPNDLLSGGFLPQGKSTPYLYGTLSLTLPLDLQAGKPYTFFVDSIRDGEFSSIGVGAVSESLTGTGTIIVPEPASIALLGLGAVGLIRRRRTA